MTTTRAFSGVAFNTASAGDAEPVSLGFEFELSEPAFLTELHFWQATTGESTALRTLAVYEIATGGQVDGTLVTKTPSGPGWQTAVLPTPVALAAETRYRAMCFHSAGRYVVYTHYFDGGGPNESTVTVGPIVIPSAAEATDGRQGCFRYAPQIEMGDVSFNAANYGTDITIVSGGELLATTRDVLGLTDSLTTETSPSPSWPYTNTVAYALSANGTNSTSITTATATGGTVLRGAPFAPTAGRLLLAVINGGVTSATPAGWTLVRSAVQQRGLYVFSRTASGTAADAFATTHNGSNYPRLVEFIEFPSGTAVTGSDSVTSGSNPTVGGLTGTNEVLFFAAAGPGPLTWAGKYAMTTRLTPDPNGFSHASLLRHEVTGSSATATASQSFERIAVAVKLPAGVDRSSTATDIMGLADSLTTVLDAVRSMDDPLGLSDDLTVALGRLREITDTIGLADDLTVLLERVRESVLTDPLGLADQLQVIADRAREITDVIGLRDSLTVYRLDENRPHMTSRSAQFAGTRGEAAFAGTGTAAEFAVGPVGAAEFIERG